MLAKATFRRKPCQLLHHFATLSGAVERVAGLLPDVSSLQAGPFLGAAQQIQQWAGDPQKLQRAQASEELRTALVDAYVDGRDTARSFFAGFPAQISLRGTLRVTTVPAPITDP